MGVTYLVESNTSLSINTTITVLTPKRFARLDSTKTSGNLLDDIYLCISPVEGRLCVQFLQQRERILGYNVTV